MPGAGQYISALIRTLGCQRHCPPRANPALPPRGAVPTKLIILCIRTSWKTATASGKYRFGPKHKVIPVSDPLLPIPTDGDYVQYFSLSLCPNNLPLKHRAEFVYLIEFLCVQTRASHGKLPTAGWCHGASFSPGVLTVPGPANISRSFPVCVLLSEEIGSPGLGGLLLILWWYQGFTGTLVISQRGNGKTGQSLPAVSHQRNMDKHTLACLCVCVSVHTHTDINTHQPVRIHTQRKCNNTHSYCNANNASAAVD